MHDTGSGELYVVGAGGHGREIHAYLRDLVGAGSDITLRGFLDDGLSAGSHGGLEVVGSIKDGPNQFPGLVASRYLTAIGNNKARRDVVQRLEKAFGSKLFPWTLIHPRAWIGGDSEIGDGSCLAPGVIVTAKTRIGLHSIINVKASISHDCTVGDFVNINPNATICGSVTIGEGAFIGAGATIKEGVSVGEWSIIGAGAAVIRDVPPNATAVGVPARIIKVRQPTLGAGE